MKKNNNYCGYYNEMPQNTTAQRLPLSITEENAISLMEKHKYCDEMLAGLKSEDITVHFAAHKTEKICVADWYTKIYDVADPFLNLSPGNKQLYINWLIGYLNNGTTLPILIIDGPEGSGKSTLCEITQAIVNTDYIRNYFCREAQDITPVTLTGQETSSDMINTIKQRELTVYENVSALTTSQITGMLAAGCTPLSASPLEKHKAVILTTNSLAITDSDLLNHSIRLETLPLKKVRPKQDILDDLGQKLPDIYKAIVALLACICGYYIVYRILTTVPEDEPEKLKTLYDYVLLGHLIDNIIYKNNNFYPYFVSTQLQRTRKDIVSGPVS